MGEGLGAVDRIDDPGAAAGPGDVVLLLAEDGVVGEAGLDLLADEAFGGPVGLGDRCAVALAVDLEIVSTELPHRELTGLADRVTAASSSSGSVGVIRSSLARGSFGLRCVASSAGEA